MKKTQRAKGETIMECHNGIGPVVRCLIFFRYTKSKKAGCRPEASW